MSKAPRLTGKQLLTALAIADSKSCGCGEAITFLRHKDGRTTVVPVHSGELVEPGLLAKILRDSDLSGVELLDLLR